MSAPLTFEEMQRHMTQKLSAAASETAALDARLLLQYAGGLSQTELALAAHVPIEKHIAEQAVQLCAMRAAGKPVAKIIGVKEFWGRDFCVNQHVLDPRPDSETLIETALHKLFDNQRVSVLDLGTGSGCLILTLLAETKNISGMAVDKSRAALALARRNAHRLGLRHRVAMRRSDWFSAISGRFDMIVSNPPYVETAALAQLPQEVRAHDPRSALDGGVDGLAPYRLICRTAAGFLKPGGYLIFEFGLGQGAAIEKLMSAGGFSHIDLKADLTGRDRIVVGQKRQ